MKYCSAILSNLIYCLLLLVVAVQYSFSQTSRQTTCCNPLNLDYTYIIYNAHNDLSYRSRADPAVAEFRGEDYMFVTRSMGNWHSKDLLHWSFIEPETWYFQGSNENGVSEHHKLIKTEK